MIAFVTHTGGTHTHTHTHIYIDIYAYTNIARGQFKLRRMNIELVSR